MRASRTTVEQHLSAYCGTVTKVWGGERVPFHIVELSGGPHPGSKVIATLGLSDNHLFSEAGLPTWLELIAIVRTDQHEFMPQVLSVIGNRCVLYAQAMSRGHIIRFGGEARELLAGTPFAGFYATMPVYFPDDFFQIGDIILPWIIPVTQSELSFVEQRGWNAFEDLLTFLDPDLTDIDRPSVC